ncbi:SDR family NAD(P)-dependent oxidoreductase [Pendulispora albinea]|uniref:SDR family oxidoreductase n=1 Tax=Pendulispora albinea TaxID=2741071 RepID=A0ABZ2MAX1_9BACT
MPQPTSSPTSPTPERTLHGKSAIVTGGATGIGRATVLRLVDAGAHVVFSYSRSAREAEETESLARGRAGSARAIRADVRAPTAIAAMVNQAVHTQGRLDLLVNNAAVSPPVPAQSLGDLDAFTDELWDTVLAVNVRGAFACARAAAPHLRAARGAVVNVGSIAGLTGEGSSLPYAVSKAALHGLSKSLSRALAPEVRVSCVVPGFVRTRWWDGREDVVEKVRRRSLLDEPTRPEDVAELICNLALQHGLTGQLITIDGGQTV